MDVFACHATCGPESCQGPLGDAAMGKHDMVLADSPVNPPGTFAASTLTWRIADQFFRPLRGNFRERS
jgi:hypothetical protein